MIVRIINLNKATFGEYFMPTINQPTISAHINHMLKPGVWGTYLEVKAAATLFQIPIYFCSISPPSSVRRDYKWSVCHPISPDKISFPLIFEGAYEGLPSFQRIHHIEMLHHENSHYNVVVSTETGKLCETPPELTGRDDPQEITLDIQ